MKFDWWTLALQTINFAILVWLLHRFLYKPVLRMIDARKTDIGKHYDAAKAAEAKAKAELAAVEAERARIAAEREAVLTAAAASGEEAVKKRLAEAKSQAEALLDGARKKIATERGEAMAQMQHIALDLGSDYARRLLAAVPRRLRQEAWLEHIEQYLAGLPKDEHDGLVQQIADGARLTVVTAAPLSPELVETWQARLRQSLGTAITCAFDVDPALVAGADLHFPSAMLRFSWQSALAALRKELEADGNTR